MKETLTTINTTYARICVILLAANLLLTGYTINKVSDANTPEQETVKQEVPESEQ
jgi:hypothetical protein